MWACTHHSCSFSHITHIIQYLLTTQNERRICTWPCIFWNRWMSCLTMRTKRNAMMLLAKRSTAMAILTAMSTATATATVSSSSLSFSFEYWNCYKLCMFLKSRLNSTCPHNKKTLPSHLFISASSSLTLHLCLVTSSLLPRPCQPALSSLPPFLRGSDFVFTNWFSLQVTDTPRKSVTILAHTPRRSPSALPTCLECHQLESR